MQIKQIITKYKIVLMVILIIIVLSHTILISNGYTFYFYERLRDLFISIAAMILIIYNINCFKKKNKSAIIYLILANFFVLIFIIHLLRLFFGGLQC